MESAFEKAEIMYDVPMTIWMSLPTMRMSDTHSRRFCSMAWSMLSGAWPPSKAPLLEKKKAQTARQREIAAWPTKLTMIWVLDVLLSMY